jgi:hypothetical protein
MGHRSAVVTESTGHRFSTIYRAVCSEGCGRGPWRTALTSAQADARRHAKDTTEAETYRNVGGTDV